MSDKAGQDNRSNQMNPNNPAYDSSRGGSGSSQGPSMDQAGTDNRANQMNPNNPAYESSRSGSKGKWANVERMAHSIARKNKQALPLVLRISFARARMEEAGITYLLKTNYCERQDIRRFRVNTSRITYVALQKILKQLYDPQNKDEAVDYFLQVCTGLLDVYSRSVSRWRRRCHHCWEWRRLARGL